MDIHRRYEHLTASDYFSALRSANELINGALAPHPEDLVIVVEENLRQLGRDHLDEAQAIAPVVCVQNRFSLDGQTHREVLEACRERGIAFVPFFAIAAGRRSSGGPGGASAAVEEVARRHGVSAAQVRLAWTLHQGPNVLAIPGTSNPAHVAANVAAAALRLTLEDLSLLR